MKLANAIRKFSDTVVKGTTSTTSPVSWVDGVSTGHLLTYDRFITERTFGAVKRLFLTSEAIPLQYHTLLIGESPYIVSSVNEDRNGAEGEYSYTYLLTKGGWIANLKRYTVTPASSGVGGTKTLSTVATLYCNIDRRMGVRSTENIPAGYIDFTITLPSVASTTVDDIIEIDGVNYDVREVYNELLTVKLEAIKRA